MYSFVNGMVWGIFSTGIITSKERDQIIEELMEIGGDLTIRHLHPCLILFNCRIRFATENTICCTARIPKRIQILLFGIKEAKILEIKHLQDKVLPELKQQLAEKLDKIPDFHFNS